MIVIAHAGHWLAGLAYAAPVFVLAGWLATVKLKDRGAQRDGSSRSPD